MFSMMKLRTSLSALLPNTSFEGGCNPMNAKLWSTRTQQLSGFLNTWLYNSDGFWSTIQFKYSKLLSCHNQNCISHGTFCHLEDKVVAYQNSHVFWKWQKHYSKWKGSSKETKSRNSVRFSLCIGWENAN